MTNNNREARARVPISPLEYFPDLDLQELDDFSSCVVHPEITFLNINAYPTVERGTALALKTTGRWPDF